MFKGQCSATSRGPSPVATTELFERAHQPSWDPEDAFEKEALAIDHDALVRDTDVAELEAIDGWLWMIGSEDNISALHHQRVLLRDIIPTDQMRLHLVWFDRIIYIKPFPPYLFDHDFVQENISPDTKLRRNAKGFLLSYCSLIQSPLDVEIAQGALLLPKGITWKMWSAYRRSVKAAAELEGPIQGRYRRGELRLHRLNLVYRVTGRGLVYFTVHRQYDTYFRQFTALFLTVFALLATVLTATQIMVGVEGVSRTVRDVCYGTAIAAVIFETACLVDFAGVFTVFFVWNSVMAWEVKKRVGASRAEEAGKRTLKREAFVDA